MQTFYKRSSKVLDVYECEWKLKVNIKDARVLEAAAHCAKYIYKNTYPGGLNPSSKAPI
jgi:hypothetical protein